MLFVRIFLLIIVWRLSRCAELSLTKTSNNYGHYDMTITKYEVCKGPKAANATTIEYEMKTDKSGTVIIYNTTFHVNTRLSEIKIQVWHFNGNQKMTLWNYKVDNPCHHFAITSILASCVNLQPNCMLKKGSYHFAVNLNKVAPQFFGDSFFYGEFSFKHNSLSNQGNVMCIIFNILFSKKTT